MRRRVASNLLWMLAERGLQVAAGIGIVAMLARALGPEGFAHFQYAQAVVTIASSVALICVAEVLVPRLVGNSDRLEQHRLLTHAFALRTSGAALGYALMCSYLWLTDAQTESKIAALLLGVSILLREPVGVVNAWMQAHTNNRPGTIFSLVSLIAKVSLVALLFATGIRHVTSYAGAFAVESVILALLLGLYYLTRVEHRRMPLDAELGRELFRSGALFWASFMMMMAARRVDQLILQPLVPPTEFSAYAACMQILDNYSAVAVILVAGIAPTYVYGKSEFSVARLNVGRIAVLLGAVGLAGACVIGASSEWIIHLLYGNQFSAAASLLRLAAFASMLVFVDVALTLLPIYLRRPEWIALKWAATLVATLACDLFAIPKYGAWGAVAGYAVGNGIAVFIGVGIWSRMRHRRALASGVTRRNHSAKF